MTTLIFSAGGCPSYPSYSFERGPWYLFLWPVTENPSRGVANKDHSSSNPRKGNPPDLKTKVDVAGFPTESFGYRFPKQIVCSIYLSEGHRFFFPRYESPELPEFFSSNAYGSVSRKPLPASFSKATVTVFRTIVFALNSINSVQMLHQVLLK